MTRYDERGGCVGCGCIVPLMIAPVAITITTIAIRLARSHR